MPTRDDVWLAATGAGAVNKWQGVIGLLDKDASEADVIENLQEDYWGPAQGAHFWGAPCCPVRRPVAVAVDVTDDSWRKSEPTRWQQNAQRQFTSFYQQEVTDSVWAPGGVVAKRALRVYRPPANQSAIITGVVQCELSASMLEARHASAVMQAAHSEIATAFGHPADRVSVDSITGPKCKFHVRVEASWAEAAKLSASLARACGGMKLAKTEEAFRRATGLSEASAAVISSKCVFAAPRQQATLLGDTASARGAPFSKSPADLHWVGTMTDELAASASARGAPPSQPSMRSAPKPAPKARVASAAAAPLSDAPVAAAKKAPTVARATPKTALGTTAAPQTEAEKAALAAKRKAILMSKMKPKEEPDPSAPPPAEAPKTLGDQITRVKKLLTINSYWRGAINFVGQVGGVLQRHLENYELMIDAWDDATKTLRGWHMHASRMREVKRPCTIRCFRRDKQLLVQIKDDVMLCKARLAGADKLEGEVTLPGFSGKFTLQRDELGYP